MAGSIRGPERRIVLVGKSGSGISATGNTILGSKIFQFEWPDYYFGTYVSQKEETQLKGRKVVVVDTPGFFHTHRPQEEIAAEVSKCVKLCFPGPHVILHVVHPLFSSKQEMDVIQHIEEIFGFHAYAYMIILFTCKNSLSESLQKFISSRGENLEKYIAHCGNRYLFFDNKAKGREREAQVAELMTMIDDLVHKNSDAPCYTEDMLNVK